METLVRLSCVDRDYAGHVWSLDRQHDAIVILNHKGEKIGSCDPVTADDRFVLPNPLLGTKLFTINFDRVSMEFTANANDVERVRRFIDGAVIAQGPVAIAKKRSKGIKGILAGMAAIMVGIFVGAVIYGAGLDPRIGSSAVIVMFGGVCIIARGLFELFEYRRLQRLQGVKTV